MRVKQNKIVLRRLEIHISYKCLNRCIFCSERTQINAFRNSFVETNKIKKIIKFYALNGTTHISFTGGEPSEHKNLTEFLKFAKSYGCKTYVSSNGGKFSSLKFCKNTLPYIDELCFSIHGPSARLHDQHTKNEKSFNNLITAIKNIKKIKKDVFCLCNTVITKSNISHLKDTVKLIKNLRIFKLALLSNMAPEGAGAENYAERTVELSQLKKQVPTVTKQLLSKNIQPRFFGIPLCVLKGYEKYSNDTWWSPRTTIEKWKLKQKKTLKITHSLKPTRYRVKTKKCAACVKKRICGGLFEKYYSIFGDSELSPYETNK